MQHRVLIFSKSKKRTRFARSLARALVRAGHRARVLNFPRLRRLVGERNAHRMALTAFEAMRPDLVFVYAKDIALETFAILAQRVPTVVFSEDLVVPLDPKLLDLARLAEVFLLTNRTQTEEAVGLGVPRSAFIRGAVDPEEFRRFEGRVAPRWRSEVAFIGRPGNEGRHRLLRRLSSQFEVKIYGSRDWPRLSGLPSFKTSVFPRDYAKICAGAKVVIGLDVRQDFECYCSNRTWLTLGCGGFLVTSASRGMEEVIEHGRHALLYHSEEECEELVRSALEEESRRREIAEAGYRFVLGGRTFEHFAVEMLDAVAGKPLPFNREPAANLTAGTTQSP